MALNFDNITISGSVGVGTTTLMDNLRPYLTDLGWDFQSMGQFIRKQMKENVMPVATLVSDDFDRDIEHKVYEALRDEKSHVIEAWLAGFVARDLPKTLRIMLVCSEMSIRVDRVMNRDNINVDTAKQFIIEREQENIKKWKRVYGDHDFFHPDHYHIVVDTYASGPMSTVGIVLDKLGYENKR